MASESTHIHQSSIPCYHMHPSVCRHSLWKLLLIDLVNQSQHLNFRRQASQSQIKALVNYATFRFRPWWCPGAIGAPYITNSQCNPPGICSWFRCVNCNRDSQCASNRYCRGRYNPFIVNECALRKANGKLCSRDAMCLSGETLVCHITGQATPIKELLSRLPTPPDGVLVPQMYIIPQM